MKWESYKSTMCSNFAFLGQPKSLLIFFNLLSACLILFLCFSARPAADDFHFMHNVLTKGVWHASWWEYCAWSTRWVSVLLNHTVLWLYFKWHPALNLFFALLYVFMLLSVRSFLKVLRENGIGSGLIQNFGITTMSFFVVHIVFLFTPGKGETWFWLCSSCTYLLSVIAAIAGFSMVLTNKGRWWNVLVASFCFMVVGGTNESLFVFLILLPGIFFLFRGSMPFTNMYAFKNLPAFLAGCISFGVVFFGPGNLVRQSFLPRVGLPEAYVYNVKTTGMVILTRMPETLIYLVLFVLIVSCWGISRQKSVPSNGKIAFLGSVCLLFGSLVFTYHFSITYLMHDIGPDRALFPLFVFVLLLAAIVFPRFLHFFAGYEKWKYFSGKFALLVLIILVGFQLVFQTSIARTYSHAWDARMELLSGCCQAQNAIEVPPLPKAGWLYSAEISVNPNHFLNQHLKNGLQLKQDVVLKKE